MGGVVEVVGAPLLDRLLTPNVDVLRLRLEALVAGILGRAERLIASYLDPLTRQDVFNRYQAERALLLASDLPGLKFTKDAPFPVSGLTVSIGTIKDGKYAAAAQGVPVPTLNKW